MRKVELIVTLVFLLLAMVLGREAIRIGSGWTSDGPGAGFVPFWLALTVVVASVVLLVQAMRPGAHPQEPFFPSRAAGLFWLKMLIPMAIAVGLIPSLGIYVVAAVYLAVFAAWMGRHRWFVVLGVSVLIPLVMYVSFERFFKLPLPKSLWYGHGLPF